MSEKYFQTNRQRTQTRRADGFTLVEMLVSVTLVLLMMTMFAQVFQMAGSSISTQRGLAENDQRSRTLQTLLKSDLDKRSFRWVYPFAASEDVSSAESFIGKRQGYFYISENNPNSKIDDVLQFTVMSSMTARNRDTSPYYGKADNLTGFNFALNQPDADDAQASSNNTGLSRVAEIAYFVRNGNLYRRQLLIREPLSTFTSNPDPTDNNGNLLFDPDSTNPLYSSTGQFWDDYDYSAYLGLNVGLLPYAHFLGTDHLDNSGKTYASVAIAKPHFRFGFSPGGITGVTAGRPKEFSNSTTTATYIGRFTMQECSSVNFRYPQSSSTNGNVPTNPTLALTLDPNDSTVTGPDDFSDGFRRGEDLLLSNVHGFDIQVWDELAQSFVNIGDPALAAASADYAPGNRYAAGIAIGTPPSPTYGPRITENASINAINAVFDTWHPYLNLNTSNDPATDPDPTTGQTIGDEPPYRATYFRPAAVSGGGGTFDKPSWVPDTEYFIGDIVFPTGPPTVPQTFPPPFSPPGEPGQLPYGAPFYYRCIAKTGGGRSSAISQPVWPKIDSLKVPDNELVWQAVENRKPLRAIKLEIRFIDPSTQQTRQLTLIQSLVD